MTIENTAVEVVAVTTGSVVKNFFANAVSKVAGAAANTPAGVMIGAGVVGALGVTYGGYKAVQSIRNSMAKKAMEKEVDKTKNLLSLALQAMAEEKQAQPKA